MQNKYKVVIIGTGGQSYTADCKGSGNEHKTISFTKALNEHEGFELEYYVNPKEYGGKIGNKEVFPAFNIVNDIDVFIIASPDETHFDWLTAIGQFSCPRLVICEKPLCTNLSQAKEIVHLYNDNGIALMVNYTRNFIPELRVLKDRKPVSGICHYNRGFEHTGTHAIAFFKMLGVENIDLIEMPEGDRYWSLEIKFEDGTYWKESIIGDEKPPSYYDFHMKYVINNAYNFLEGKEKLICTGRDALNSFYI